MAFTIREGRLFTLRERELPAFRLYRMRVRNQTLVDGNAYELLLDLFETKIEQLADEIENIYSDTEKLSRVIMEGHQGDEYDEALSTLAELEDIGWKVRLCLMDTQRALNFLVRKARLPAGQLEQAREILRDIESLLPHNESLFQKVNFLMQAAMGFINIEQNRIIKIFSVVSVVFLPPTLVASSYGMNFEFMPELHWSFGYPGAIVFMMLAGPRHISTSSVKLAVKRERRLPSLLADAGLASAQPALGIQRIDDKHRQRDPDKAKGHHFILARHFAVERHRQQEHQRWADVLEKAQRGEPQTRCRPGKAQQRDGGHHARAISSRLSDRGSRPYGWSGCR